MSDFLWVSEGEVDAKPVGLVFCGCSLLAEPQVQNVEGTWAQAHGADTSVFLRPDHSRVLEDAQVLHE
jgi:hypothetical protein